MIPHTQPPWLSSEPAPNTGLVTISGGRSGGKTIAYVNYDTLMSREEHEANVRLIAAAPALLEALQNLVSACEQNHDGHDDSICSVCTFGALAEVAIGKALGQEAVA